MVAGCNSSYLIFHRQYQRQVKFLVPGEFVPAVGVCRLCTADTGQLMCRLYVAILALSLAESRRTPTALE